MQTINNKDKKLKDDLKEEIKKGSKLSIVAASFSIYAYRELKEELESIDELRFIFNSPTFIKGGAKKEKREFYIPRHTREQSLFGTEFEVKLKNELTQKSIAKECAEWMRKKVKFKSNISDDFLSGFILVDDKAYSPIYNFTTKDLGADSASTMPYLINKVEAPYTKEYIEQFEHVWNDKKKLEDVSDKVVESISTVYNENTPDYLYFLSIYNIFKEFLDDLSEDNIANERTKFKESVIWNKLYNFQKDAALSIINKLETYNGCILADSVGLGKTFTALAVIKYYELRNKTVLVLCPKKLANNWNTFREPYSNNPVFEDRFNYTVLFHTDLSRDKGLSNGKSLDKIMWSNFDLVVIDESHNFRNGGKVYGEDEKENRYLKLMNKVIKSGVKTKVLMLSATPVNNRFNDLKNQIELAYEGDSEKIEEKLDTKNSIDDIFRQAQKSYNTWCKLKPEQRTTNNLLDTLDFDFFTVLDSVSIARSRKQIESYYDTSNIGIFPKRMKPISKSPGLTDLEKAISYREISDELDQLNLAVYTPSVYIKESRIEKYILKYDSKGYNTDNIGLTQAGREKGIRRLMFINLMKRLESSVYSFRLTLNSINDYIKDMINIVEDYQNGRKGELDIRDYTNLEYDEYDVERDVFTIGKKVRIDLEDMDDISWLRELKRDKETLDLLISMVSDISPQYDSKLNTLKDTIDHKINNPINHENKKILIFTAFADTADYLYKNLSNYIKEKYNLETALVTGSKNTSTVKRLASDFNDILTCFSPQSKDRELLKKYDDIDIDVLIATDCISEGQNLQDCDYLINYDIHWNPVRIIQRFGRIDRIGSKNDKIQLVNFWPNISLDEYINLKARVETRMKIVDMTATGDDNPLSPEEENDLEYRKEQLKKLKDEVVDLEDMSNSVSITDLNLDTFRSDLTEYIREHPDLEDAPRGMNAIVKATEDYPSGVIFILKNLRNEININSQNRLHPFYMVYVDDDGSTFISHLAPKKLLDTFRYFCKGKTSIDKDVYTAFNKETKDGKYMKKYSDLLSEAISSIIQVKDQSTIEGFLDGKDVSFLEEKIEGLDDFELVSFLVIKGD